MNGTFKIREFFAGLYVITITYLLFFASFREGTNTDVHIIPFETTYELISAHWNRTVWWMYFSILANFLLLFPIPFLFKLKWNGWTTMTMILIIPIVIESVQYVLQVGSADIDDVIFNAAGFACGFLIPLKKN